MARLCTLFVCLVCVQSTLGLDCLNLADFSADTCTSNADLAAVTIHSDEGIEGHKYVTIAPGSPVVSCEDHPFITECAGDESKSPKCSNHQATFCSAGCAPFTRLALEVRSFADCLIQQAHIAATPSVFREFVENWVDSDFYTAFERMSTHAYKKRSLIESESLVTKDYIVQYLTSGVAGSFRGLALEMGGNYQQSGDLDTYAGLLAQIEKTNGDYESHKEITSGQGKNIHQVSRQIFHFYQGLVDNLATCFTPVSWDNMYCAPALWPYVGFYAGLRYRTDGWTHQTSNGREGTHYYAHPSCARAAVTKLLAWQAATWDTPGWKTSVNKVTADTVNPSPGTKFSCQGFTHGFKLVMSSPTRYGLPDKCEPRVEKHRRQEEMLDQLEQDLALLI